ncbi:WLM-domain-containing protein [Dendrothele bispora CBS 962.96]|uniref:WLM-domain-containing protein n=1 Tax=Dendrothele bispora (strain CBS 962.96) TaxID=1314807 RepID=A0A4S8MIK6_DENBC|nr:WLM-domain-containing protein [Dendrothele bispora CBS 962.96]
MASGNSLNLTVAHRGQSYSLSLLPDETLATLQARLEELTSIPPHFQKLLYKGKSPRAQDQQMTLAQAGLKDGMKVQMLGTTTKEVDGLSSIEAERQKRNRILRERASKAPVKVRSTGTANSSSLNYRFHELIPLSHLPNPESARALLQRLSDDPAIAHIMQKHEFSVGILTELAPHEHPQLLGLNVNAGQQIKLRLRTDRYDGFRTYREVRRVLCHELTHNVHGDHDNNFKELNSRLNREVAEYERAVSAGTHSLSEYDGSMYEPSASLEAEARGHALSGVASLSLDSVEDRRMKMLAAAEARLRKEEEELEDSCGTAGPSAVDKTS